MLSPIQTRRHWVTHFTLTPSQTPSEEAESTGNFSFNHWECKKHWHARLKFSFGPKDSNKPTKYSGEVEFEGIFDLHDDFPKEQSVDLVRMNGGAILYGAIRELILSVSARSAHGPYEVPTIDARAFLKADKSPQQDEIQSIEAKKA